MVRKSDHSKLVTPSEIDDAEGELTQREAPAPVPPAGAELRMGAQQGKRALELGDESVAKFGTAFTSIEDRFSRFSSQSASELTEGVI